MTLQEPLNPQAIADVEREHAELRQLIGTIQKNLADPSRPAALVKNQLTALGQKLEDHFQTEEHGGFFAQITDQAPRLATQADKLCDEHQALLVELLAITDQTQADLRANSTWANLQQAFHAFSKHLMNHESEENEMLQEAYWEDIGPAD